MLALLCMFVIILFLQQNSLNSMVRLKKKQCCTLYRNYAVRLNNKYIFHIKS
jgi:hypothetical protein